MCKRNTSNSAASIAIKTCLIGGCFLIFILVIIGVLDYVYPRAPLLPNITTPSLRPLDRIQINKDILFEKAFKQFGECMKDADKTTAKKCKQDFWDSAKPH